MDSKKLREAFSQFTTGVCIVSTKHNNHLYGMTINSFTSVSLNPPILLWCLNLKSFYYKIFSKAPKFSINILSYKQKNLSLLFASEGQDRFSTIDYSLTSSNMPIFPDSLGYFICLTDNTLIKGDHLIILGKIVDFKVTQGSPLIFSQSQYRELKS